MQNTIHMLTYKQLSALSKDELTKCVGLALGQLDKALKQGEDIIVQAQIYQVYENELAKRNFKRRTY